MIPFKSFMCIMTLVHNLGITNVSFDPKKNHDMVITFPYEKWQKFSDYCNKGDVEICTFIAEHLSEMELDPVKKECKMVYKF